MLRPAGLCSGLESGGVVLLEYPHNAAILEVRRWDGSFHHQTSFRPASAECANLDRCTRKEGRKVDGSRADIREGYDVGGRVWTLNISLFANYSTFCCDIRQSFVQQLQVRYGSSQPYCALAVYVTGYRGSVD